MTGQLHASAVAPDVPPPPPSATDVVTATAAVCASVGRRPTTCALEGPNVRIRILNEIEKLKKTITEYAVLAVRLRDSQQIPQAMEAVRYLNSLEEKLSALRAQLWAQLPPPPTEPALAHGSTPDRDDDVGYGLSLIHI